MATQTKTKRTKTDESKAPGEYKSLVATCACGASFETGSTLEVLRVDICSQCHPFFTGEKRFVDSEGRVEKFKKKYNLK